MSDNQALMNMAVLGMGRQVFMDQLNDDMVAVRSVATPDQMKAINAGVRLVFDCIDNYGYQIVGEDGESLNPPIETSVDLSLTGLWDDYVARINS